MSESFIFSKKQFKLDIFMKWVKININKKNYFIKNKYVLFEKNIEWVEYIKY